MAAINTTFGFRDQITQSIAMLNQTLMSMNAALAEMRGQTSGANVTLSDMSGQTSGANAAIAEMRGQISGVNDVLAEMRGQISGVNAAIADMSGQMSGQMSGASAAMESASKSAEKTAGKVGGISAKLLNFNLATQAFSTIRRAFGGVTSVMGEMSAAYDFQMAQETKLASVMRARMGATEEMIQDIKDFASEQQQLGIIGDEVMLAGAQELATYISDANTLKTLIPMLNDMAVQAAQGGEVSAQLETSLATMVGKVMAGNLSGMSKRGWSFTDAEAEAFKAMDEAQRAVFLANYAKDAVNQQNFDFARTAQGQIMQLNNALGDMKEEVGKAVQPFYQLYTITTINWKIKFYENIVKALEFVKSHMNQVIIVLGALGAAIAVVGVAFIATAIASAVAWAAAHIPLVVIVGIILLLITVIAALLVFSSKTFPAIGGFIGGVAGIAKEVGAQIKYYFQVAIEGIVNGFLTMKNKVVGAFLTMFDFLLSGVEKVAGGLDKVFGTSFANSIAGFRETLNTMKNAEQVKFSLGWEDNRRGFANAWAEGQAAGRQTGADLAEKMNNSISKLTNKFNTEKQAITGGMGGIFSGIDDRFTFDSNGALKTTDSGLVEIADDYRQLLSRRATERFNLKFSQVTPEVNFNGVTINNNADLDDAIERFVLGVEQASSSSLAS